MVLVLCYKVTVFAIFAVLGGSANKLLRDSAVSKGGIVIQRNMAKR